MKRVLIAVVVACACLSSCSQSPSSEPEAEADEPDEHEEENNEPGNGGADDVHPRWVLYDGDGEAVDAIVGHSIPRPEWGSGSYDPESVTRRCVSVRQIGDRMVPLGGAFFDTETGDMATCTGHYEPNVVFLDEECEGRRFASSSHYYNVGGEVMWPEGELREPEAAFRPNSDGECIEVSADVVYPLEPVASHIRNALDNPPYEVRAEY